MVSTRAFGATLGLSLLLAGSAVATVAPVGLLESVDVQVLHGGQSLYHYTGVATTNKLDGQDILLGTLGDGTNISLRVQADARDQTLLDDRWMQFALRATDAGGQAANLFDPGLDGEIQVKLTNMKFSNAEASNDVRIEPFHPWQYGDMYTWGGNLPFFYMLDGYRGFINLPWSEKYSPAESGAYNLAWPSVQVPMWAWANAYGFTQVDDGHLTGFTLSGIPDFGGAGPNRDGALPVTPILYPPQDPYFGPTAVPDIEDRGFASEMSVCLNFRGFTIPEPAPLFFFLLPLAFFARHRRR